MVTHKLVLLQVPLAVFFPLYAQTSNLSMEKKFKKSEFVKIMATEAVEQYKSATQTHCCCHPTQICGHCRQNQT
jgi:hypothetical protein